MDHSQALRSRYVPFRKGLKSPQIRPTTSHFAPDSWIWYRFSQHWFGNCLSSSTKSISMEDACGNHGPRAAQPNWGHRRSLTNMAVADVWLIGNTHMALMDINNRRTKHYTYSYIHVQTFTKTKPVSLSNPTMQPCLLAKPVATGPVDGLKIFCCSNCTYRV